MMNSNPPHPADSIAPSPKAPAATTATIKFSGRGDFFQELRKRVDAYFENTGRSRRDCPEMYVKTAMIFVALAAVYALLLFVVTSWWLIAPLAVALGLLMAAIGLNIQHDGAHNAYSDRQWINKLMALSLDLMGGSSYLWDWKHNSIHHTYTNISGHDDDIDIGFLGRLSPAQKRLAFHRLQAIYLWPLYGLLAIKWHFFDDFYSVAIGRIGAQKIARPKGRDLLIFVGGKLLFFSLAFAIPLLFHPLWPVLIVYGIAAFICGLVLSVVFQLAHCVPQADFPVPVPAPGGPHRIDSAWAVHQVQTTVNFARHSRPLRWLLGGLNFQIEHHLFHKICHVHYPALSKVVEETCREFNVRYTVHKSFLSALASHFRWLVIMGRPATAV